MATKKSHPAVQRLRSQSIAVKRDRRATVIQQIMQQQQGAGKLAKGADEQQVDTFANWMNFILRDRGIEIKDMIVDMQDGVALINVLEVLVGKAVPKYNKECRVPAHRVENAIAALHFMDTTCGLRGNTVGTAEDLYAGSPKFILRTLWAVIEELDLRKRLGIAHTGQNVRQHLIKWIETTIGDKPQYKDIDIKPKTLTACLSDGILYCALIHSVLPEAIPFERLHKEDKKANLALAIDVASSQLQVPKLIDPAVMAESARIDERCMILYLSYLYDAISKRQPAAPAAAAAAADADADVADAPESDKVDAVVPAAAAAADSSGLREENAKLRQQTESDAMLIADLKKEISALKKTVEQFEQERRTDIMAASINVAVMPPQDDDDEDDAESAEAAEQDETVEEEGREGVEEEEEEEEKIDVDGEIGKTHPKVINARLEGDSVEGRPLHFRADYVDCESGNCIYVWSRHLWRTGELESLIEDAEKPTYMPNPDDVGYFLRCECTPVVVAGQSWEEGEAAAAVTESKITVSEPRIKNFKIIGGRYHTTPLVITREYYGGKEGKSVIRWMRSMQGGPFKLIPEAASMTYQPTADDVASIIRCTYTPVRDDGVEGRTMRCDFKTLTLEPNIKNAISKVVDDEGGAFRLPHVEGREGMHLLEITRKSYRLLDPSDMTVFSEKYNPDMDVKLEIDEQNNSFTLRTRKRAASLRMTCRNMSERDVLVVCMRSFWASKYILRTDGRKK